MHTHTYIHVHTYMRAHTYVHTHAHMCMHTHRHIYTYMCVCICVRSVPMITCANLGKYEPILVCRVYPLHIGGGKLDSRPPSCVVFLTAVGACEKCCLLNKESSLAMRLQSKHHGNMPPPQCRVKEKNIQKSGKLLNYKLQRKYENLICLS